MGAIQKDEATLSVGTGLVEKHKRIFTLEMTENENVAHFVLLRNPFFRFVAAGL